MLTVLDYGGGNLKSIVKSLLNACGDTLELKNESKEDAVQLLTMHGAKGLEYEIVFLPDVNEGVAPHNKAVLDADVEEERRLFYVAMTRAKTKLIMSYVKTRLHHETDPSRFLDEIFPESAKSQT